MIGGEDGAVQFGDGGPLSRRCMAVQVVVRPSAVLYSLPSMPKSQEKALPSE